MSILQKTFYCFVAFMGFIGAGYGQAQLSNTLFADPYSCKTFNKHQYIVYRAFDDTVRNNYTIGDIRRGTQLIKVYFNWVFDYHLTPDSVLSVVAYQSKPHLTIPNKDTVSLAFFRYDLRTATRLDSTPLINLHYYKFDQEGYIGVKQKDAAGVLNRYLKFDATDTERGGDFLYPHRDSNYYITRDPGNGGFRIVWSPARILQVSKVKVQPGGQLLLQNNSNLFQYVSSDGLTATGQYALAFSFSEHQTAITAAARSENDWDLVKGTALQTEKINMRAGVTIDSIVHFRGSTSQLFLKINNQGDEYWSLHKAGNDSIDEGFAIRYTNILPLLRKSGKYYLLAEKDKKVKLIEYQLQKNVLEIAGFDASSLEEAEVLWAVDSSLTCRFAIRDKSGKSFNIVDLKVDRANAKSSDIEIIDNVANYFETADLLALETVKREWYLRDNKKGTFKNSLPSKQVFIKLKLNSLQPFKNINLKRGQLRKLALAEQTLNKVRTTVYLDLDDMRIIDWKPASWSEWYNKHK